MPASSPAVRSSTSARLPVIVTAAPQRASSSAVCLPRPVPPPVISATRPLSIPALNISDRSYSSLIASDHRVPRRLQAPTQRSVPKAV
jgi:hypothetical protein